MAYDVLGFLVTDKCNFTCRHCCNESQPHNSAVLELADIQRCIDEAGQIGSFREVGISGGEPFLFPSYLADIIKHASDRGFSVQVTTNCFWARSEEKARSLLTSLQSSGLTCINISVSEFHLEHNTPSRLYNAARAAIDLGIIVRVNCVCTKSFGVADARPMFQECAERIEFLSVPCLPVGRAAEAISVDNFRFRDDIPHGSCVDQFSRLAVTPTGDVFPCCSPGGFTEPLKLGNVHERTIDEIVGGTQENLLFQVLRTVGPSFFVPFIEEALGRLSSNQGGQGFVDPCHLCHTIMSNPETRQVVVKTMERLATELTLLDLTAAETFA